MHNKQKSLSSLSSTNWDDIEPLKNPSDENYQQYWETFYVKYHGPIINYILKRSGWRQERFQDAEEIAQMVLVKGLKYSFPKIGRECGIKFRVILKQLVKNCRGDFHKKYRQNQTLNETEIWEKDPVDACEEDFAEREFAQEIYTHILETTLSMYEKHEKEVLQRLWQSGGKWPDHNELALILNKSKDSARKWKERNKNIWKEFKANIIAQIRALAWGDKEQNSEVEFFSHLKLKKRKRKDE